VEREAEIGRVILLVLDGVGVGALPDAAEYGDEGSNSIANTARAVGGLQLPNLQALGLGNLTEILGVPPQRDTLGAYGRMAERSAGKDTMIGHWELAGIYSEAPLPTYPAGFPPDLVAEFERRIGRGVLGNRPASGTEIIKELGEEHLRTGKPILYTSADSVFQLAAHEEVVPIEELYRMCEIARHMLTGDHAVGRVIARPFTGRPGAFVRDNARRRDWPLPPPPGTLLDRLAEVGLPVIAVGKIEEIFAGRSITASQHAASNREAVEATIEFLRSASQGLIFTNLVEFDTLYGHRNDPVGYAAALMEFDASLPYLYAAMAETDVLFITSDHGCDPVTPSTDHSREYVPLLAVGPQVRRGVDLGTRGTFADVGATIADLLGAPAVPTGISFCEEIF